MTSWDGLLTTLWAGLLTVPSGRPQVSVAL
jgi:hypothetical protein